MSRSGKILPNSAEIGRSIVYFSKIDLSSNSDRRFFNAYQCSDSWPEFGPGLKLRKSGPKARIQRCRPEFLKFRISGLFKFYFAVWNIPIPWKYGDDEDNNNSNYRISELYINSGPYKDSLSVLLYYLIIFISYFYCCVWHQKVARIYCWKVMWIKKHPKSLFANHPLRNTEGVSDLLKLLMSNIAKMQWIICVSDFWVFREFFIFHRKGRFG